VTAQPLADVAPVPATADALFSVLLMMAPEKLAALLASAPERAAPWVRAAAQCGLAEGQVRYGRLLLEGRGVPRDQAAAVAWFARAAESGDPDACNMLGRCHENGWGVAASAEAAAAWFRKAAEAGDAWAQYNLAHLLLDGNGVDQDREEAFLWYARAAEQGHPRAMSLMGRCLEQGWGVAADATAARACYRRSAEAGYFRGQFNYATCLAADGATGAALAWFEQALEGAPVESRQAMAEALAGQAGAFGELGRRFHLLSHERQRMGEGDHTQCGGEGAPQAPTIQPPARERPQPVCTGAPSPPRFTRSPSPVNGRGE
jgi:TPR repeat protein